MFKGFDRSAFDTFHIHGLDDRMTAIKERIQPNFRAIGEAVSPDLTMLLGEDVHVHIARHARRTVNPPNDTWMAFSPDKRGYKKHPHFQVGLFDDHLFIWLAYIYELPNKGRYAEKMLAQLDRLEALPEDYVVSYDHMKKDATPVHEADLTAGLKRFRDVKKAEFLVGRHIPAEEASKMGPEDLLELIRCTYKDLAPIQMNAK